MGGDHRAPGSTLQVLSVVADEPADVSEDALRGRAWDSWNSRTSRMSHRGALFPSPGPVARSEPVHVDGGRADAFQRYVSRPCRIPGPPRVGTKKRGCKVGSSAGGAEGTLVADVPAAVCGVKSPSDHVELCCDKWCVGRVSILLPLNGHLFMPSCLHDDSRANAL